MDQLQKAMLDAIVTIVVIALPSIAGLSAFWLTIQARIALAQLKAKQPELYSQLRIAATMATTAAEQLGGPGEMKKAQALAMIRALLAEKGINVDAAALEAAIEEAVKVQFGAAETAPLPETPKP